jgi:hypothetical protein
VAVRARRVPVRQPILTELLLRLAVLVPVQRAVLVPRLPVLADARLAKVQACWALQAAHPAVPIDPRLSRRSF